jgi:hypothetical protein
MNMKIMFSPTLLYNLMHLQFISNVCEKNTKKEVKLLNIANKVKFVLNLSISFVPVYVEDRKN